MSLRTATSVRHALAVVRYTDVSHALAEKCQRCAVGSHLALSGVVEAFHKTYGFLEASEKAKSLIELLRDIPYLSQ